MLGDIQQVNGPALLVEAVHCQNIESLLAAHIHKCSRLVQNMLQILLIT